MKEAEQWLMYLQASNAQPQCGCQPIAQNQTVRGDVCLSGALQVRPGVPEGEVREPQHLNDGQGISREIEEHKLGNVLIQEAPRERRARP